MSQEKTLRERIREGEVLVAMRGSLKTGKEELADIWSTGQYDYIWIDSQHTPYSDEMLVAYCAAAADLGIEGRGAIWYLEDRHQIWHQIDKGLAFDLSKFEIWFV